MPVYPDIQPHVNDPFVLVHTPGLSRQLSAAVEHSSISEFRNSYKANFDCRYKWIKKNEIIEYFYLSIDIVRSLLILN